MQDSFAKQMIDMDSYVYISINYEEMDGTPHVKRIIVVEN